MDIKHDSGESSEPNRRKRRAGEKASLYREYINNQEQNADRNMDIKSILIWSQTE